MKVFNKFLNIVCVNLKKSNKRSISDKFKQNSADIAVIILKKAKINRIYSKFNFWLSGKVIQIYV